ncbi:outer membrane beta-barrel protein [Kaistella jeonii]|uniref:Outer membrane protein beta-barrel domain-containing protein n=1 Tax=Kaistella jeonii TaxID=266749 RepID=A0A0C1DA14_9FLAO|nr:outer membrane beta-barrel protein [Kaistella jeonii]KIA90765.1 hypothetical protein OA86_02545 [Kaistella jeonii]SFB68188.1 Opacity protein [Kaistella jeonii]VEI94613.1 Uncharacterised protein [Kaistella jeonii]
MKKILLVGAVALFASVNAQETETVGFNKGNTFMTGAVGYSSQKEGDFKNDSFTIAPSVGYFVTSNVAVGARLEYMNATATTKVLDKEFKNKSDVFTAGLFGRYYWMPASRFSIFSELNVNYATAKTTVDNGIGGTIDSKANGFGFGIAPGVNYFLSKNFALEASVGILNYSSVKPDADGAESTENFNIGLNLRDISLGLVYKF